MKPASVSQTNPNLLMFALIMVGSFTLLVCLTQAPSASTAPTPPVALDTAAVSAGRSVFLSVCAACHGPRAAGIQGLGKPLVGGSFFNSRTDEELLAFLQAGRPVDDPLNTTGVPMPARGGRLNLTDGDLLNVIAYLRSLNQAPAQR